MTIREAAIEKIRQLPESLVQEIIDFMDFIAFRHQTEVANSLAEKDCSEAWNQWFESTDHLEISPGMSTSEYQRQLLNKYRQQGLNL